MWTIQDPTQLPTTLRLKKAHSHPYLTNTFLPLWLECLLVAHRLLDCHEAWHPGDVYYDSNFVPDFISALADPQFGTSEIMFDGVTDPTTTHLARKDQPVWQAFQKAQEAIAKAPRGAIALLDHGGHWYIRVHAGDGYLFDCRTMRLSGPKPTAREIHECLLAYEGYLARCQATEEKRILANYARLLELNLQVGMAVRDVHVIHKGKSRNMHFKVRSISPAGYVDLFDGTLRGSGQRLCVWEPAHKILLSQVQAADAKMTARLVDLEATLI